MVTRTFHNITTRYNGYYYSSENISEGIYKIRKNHKDNYDRILPIYIYPTSENAKNTFPEFDKAIKKSSLAIQRHTIKDSKGKEVPSAGKWIDNNWINIGIAHFYKREFFSGIEAWEYVVRTYRKSDDKYRAMIWLIRANNEIGSVSSSEPIISLLKNERGLPADVKKELPVAMADYYLRRGQYAEASAKLTEATKNSHFLSGIPKNQRARYTFIIGQIAELQQDDRKAIQFYKRTIKMKPAYEMIFYSKIKIARLLDVKRGNSEKTKKDLLKMAKEFKNSDYYDVIYYTLGEISEKEKKIDEAVGYYKKSVQTSLINQNQKALSFLKLGEISFARAQYQPAEAYYDSAVATLPKDHPDFNAIVSRKKTLETLVGYITTIQREDSLQRVARMTEEQRNAFIDQLIANYKEEQVRKQKEIEERMNAPAPGMTSTMIPGMAPPGMAMPGEQATFYFYNPNTVALGVADFMRRWGNRRNEDHWRRSNKASAITEEQVTEATDTTGAKKESKINPALTREYYLKDLPMHDSLVDKSNVKIVYAYYHMGVLYKEELNNTPKTIATFEELNTRFPDNKYELNTYYILYRVYLAARNDERTQYYRNKILNEYPDSEFAQLIRNPELAEEMSAQKSEVEQFYTGVYHAYQSASYSESYRKADQGLKDFGKSDYADKFEFIRAMSRGRLAGIDTLEKDLKMMVARHPKSELTPLAQDVLKSIDAKKNPVKMSQDAPKETPNDTFTVNFDAEHYVFAIVPDNAKMVEDFKSRVATFNNVFYSEKKLAISATLFGDKKQLVIIKPFPNAQEAQTYFENLSKDADVFKDQLKRDLVEMYPILPSNVAFLYQKKSAEAYKLFYADQFKKLKQAN